MYNLQHVHPWYVEFTHPCYYINIEPSPIFCKSFAREFSSPFSKFASTNLCIHLLYEVSDNHAIWYCYNILILNDVYLCIMVYVSVILKISHNYVQSTIVGKRQRTGMAKSNSRNQIVKFIMYRLV